MPVDLAAPADPKWLCPSPASADHRRRAAATVVPGLFGDPKTVLLSRVSRMVRGAALQQAAFSRDRRSVQKPRSLDSAASSNLISWPSSSVLGHPHLIFFTPGVIRSPYFETD